MVPLFTIFSVCLALLEISTLCQGKPWLDLKPHILNGDDATPGQFPYQAGLTLDREGFCGGALISDVWVLTASHCVDGVSLFTVSLGAHKVFEPSEPGRIVVNTREAYRHEKFDPYSMDNDIAVVKLPQSIVFTDKIQAVSLAPRYLSTRDFTGQEMRISGWGKKAHFGDLSPTLLYADITMITNDECKKTYGPSITDKVICGVGTHSTAKNGCNGDSGGPLVYNHEGKLVHFGVLSFVNKQGCAFGKPVAYDRTDHFLDWIANKTHIKIMD